ncbi:DUF1657 domain-containing protein [Heliorestis acidaminivorans]|uniref:DUF1657 domain-containing protein n=1 Tax=Heliorestis acidaminivorans TaxID=553427 RepID=A0A6I0F1L3_9FIRM|nr:DUF1657 domain-containing protein [Heliorestis acidaminivorans]KAB2952099.1 DUF1657 domain-containing protein [Heliorestis acidaminivorans]
MTVSSQVKQTLASLKGSRATLETFATVEENEEAKETLIRNRKRLDQVIDKFEQRLSELEFEEPEYKGF